MGAHEVFFRGDLSVNILVHLQGLFFDTDGRQMAWINADVWVCVGCVNGHRWTQIYADVGCVSGPQIHG